MNWKFVLISLLFSFSSFCQQTNFTIYSWNEAKTIKKDSVFHIQFKRNKLKTIPQELKNYKKIRILDFSNNKLEELPDFIAEFEYLEVIILNKNHFNSFPKVLLLCNNLKRIHFTNNSIAKLPDDINLAINLELLDFWDNPIADFPESLVELINLKEIHAEGIKYGPKFQRKWIEKMPWVRFYFDAPCDCKE